MNGLAFDIRARLADNFSLAMQAELRLGQVIGVYGPSGSGKTSLLNTLAGLLPASGRIGVDGATWLDDATCLPTHQRNVAYIFQDSRLFPHLDVAGNLNFAWQRRRAQGPSPEQATHMLALQDLLAQRPEQLSRGQQQRVAIARALVSGAQLLLLDEPLANIDSAGRRDILARLGELQRRLGLTMLYVSHDIAELAQLADWLLVVADGQLAAQGPMLEMSSDIELALAHEDQGAAIVEASISAHDDEYGLTELALAGQPLYVHAVPGPAGATMRLRLPARDISICREKPGQTSILNVLEVTIDRIESSPGSQVLIRMRIGEQFLLARITRKSMDRLALAPGETVYAQVKSVALLNGPGEPHE